jgi:hypothetical protein
MAPPEPLQEPLLGRAALPMLKRSHPAAQVATMLECQTAAVVLLCWVPLEALSLARAHFLGGVKLFLLRDIETHMRFLISPPALILGEFMVDLRIRPL